MKQRVLGRTGLSVSEIGLGTVQFGMPYGLPDKQGHLPEIPEYEALEILRCSFESGVNFLDTARGYGNSEQVIARAIRKRQEEINVATKLDVLDEAMTDEEMARHIKESIETSRRQLDRETLDLLQVHNATPGLIKREVLLDMLAHARSREWIRFQGVSTYGVEAPEKALEQGYWDTIQMEFNLLNQQTKALFDEAQKQQVGLIIRSAMVKGAMTAKETDLPEDLKILAQKAQRFPKAMGLTDVTVPQSALLFVLSHPQVSTVLSGVQNTDQLLENLAVSDMEPLTLEQLEEAKGFELDNPQLADPRYWPQAPQVVGS